MRNLCPFIKFLFCISIIFIFLPGSVGNSAPKEPGFQGFTSPRNEPTSLLPFLDYYIDESLTMDIEEIAAQARADSFQQLVLEDLPLTEGITWLRFTLSALSPEQRPETFLLDMGQSVPGTPMLYNQEVNELSGAPEWLGNTPAQKNIFLLPEAGNEPITCYIRMEGLPGPWFSPMIRTPLNAAGNWDSFFRTSGIVALAVVMILCVLRGISENGQWRIWTGLFVGVALLQAILGMPVIGEKISMTTLAAILTPGIALILLPHAGRHLMRAKKISRGIDIQLLLLSIPGAILAILPLIPGWNWLDRWLDLWPLGTALLIPTAIGAWIIGLCGSRRFLLAVCIPPFAAAFSYAGLEFGLKSYILAAFPLWGIALSALLLAATSAQWDNVASAEPEPDLPDTKNQIQINHDILPLDNPLDDPNLRLIAPKPISIEEAEKLIAPIKKITRDKKTQDQYDDCIEKFEKSLRKPVDELMRQGAALSHCSLPPAARDHAEQVIKLSRELASIISGKPMETDNAIEPPRLMTTFNLQHLIREVHDSLSMYAENSNTALSWHMPPHLNQLYKGDFEQIKSILQMLLESAIRASDHSAVHIAVRRVPDSPDPGYLLFTITDKGSGNVPESRSSMALVKAWEMAAENEGYLGMESGPDGTTISFSLHFIPAEEDEEESSPAHLIVASEDEKKRRVLVEMLKSLPCRINEAANAREVLVCQNINPASLLITGGTLSKPAAADTIKEFMRLARQAGFSKCHALAITEDDSQWSLLKPSGFTHAMNEPIEPESLRRTVSELISQSAVKKESSDDNNDNAELVNGPLVVNLSEELPDLFEKSMKNSQTESTTIIPDRNAVPTMIVEQDLNFSANFENPAWMNEDKNPRPKNIHEPDPAHMGNTLELQGEWVGEPVPIPAQDINMENDMQRGSSLDKEEEVSISNKNGSNAVSENPGNPDSHTMPALDPHISQLVDSLDAAIRDAKTGFENRNGKVVADATSRIAKNAENFGLRHISRMAMSVEQAARENDMEALGDLLPELVLAVERNRISMTLSK